MAYLIQMKEGGHMVVHLLYLTHFELATRSKCHTIVQKITSRQIQSQKQSKNRWVDSFDQMSRLKRSNESTQSVVRVISPWANRLSLGCSCHPWSSTKWMTPSHQNPTWTSSLKRRQRRQTPNTRTIGTRWSRVNPCIAFVSSMASVSMLSTRWTSRMTATSPWLAICWRFANGYLYSISI